MEQGTYLPIGRLHLWPLWYRQVCPCLIDVHSFLLGIFERVRRAGPVCHWSSCGGTTAIRPGCSGFIFFLSTKLPRSAWGAKEEQNNAPGLRVHLHHLLRALLGTVRVKALLRVCENSKRYGKEVGPLRLEGSQERDHLQERSRTSRRDTDAISNANPKRGDKD